MIQTTIYDAFSLVTFPLLTPAASKENVTNEFAPEAITLHPATLRQVSVTADAVTSFAAEGAAGCVVGWSGRRKTCRNVRAITKSQLSDVRGHVNRTQRGSQGRNIKKSLIFQCFLLRPSVRRHGCCCGFGYGQRGTVRTPGGEGAPVGLGGRSSGRAEMYARLGDRSSPMLEVMLMQCNEEAKAKTWKNTLFFSNFKPA